MTASDTTNTTDQRDPAEIEREIRNTQQEMSRTVDQIGDQLTPKKLLNALLDKADSRGVDSDYLLDGARRNPLALAMIALGGIWLASDSDAKLSSLKPSGMGSGSDKSTDTETAWDDQHRAYVQHMSLCEPQIGEDDATYRRRRDLHRANYLMIEQGHDEDHGAFRQRLDAATEALRRKRHDMMDGMRNLGSSASSGARGVASKSGDFYQSNPLAGGIVAALVGAFAGAAAPVTRTEEEQLGKLGASALDAATEKAHQLGDIARVKKDDLVEKADEKLKQTSSAGQGEQPAQGSQPAAAAQPVPAV